MKNAEKIEALREWLGNRHSSCRCMICIELLDPIRDIIDPPRAKWRQEVDDWVAEVPYPLGSTLRELADLEYGKVDSYAYPTTVRLARIVAICEAQVGDGWQADPACWSGTVTLHTLIDRLSCDEEDDYYTPVGKVTDWQGLGHAAAAWLCSLTDGGAA